MVNIYFFHQNLMLLIYFICKEEKNWELLFLNIFVCFDSVSTFSNLSLFWINYSYELDDIRINTLSMYMIVYHIMYKSEIRI